MYSVKFYGTAEKPLDYFARQWQANKDGVDLYVEQHFNSSVGDKANYTVVVVGSNASSMSKSIGAYYAQQISKTFNTKIAGVGGLLIGGFGGRGDGNIRQTRMPAVLLEPLFGSNRVQADIIRSADGQSKLARCLTNTIKEFFPTGASIGFSIGHKYKHSHPRDRGASLVGGGAEADYAEIVLHKAAAYLTEVYVRGELGITHPRVESNTFIVEKGDTLWSISRELGLSMGKLREWNGIEGDLLTVGQELELH